MEFEVLEQYNDLTETMQGAPLSYQISDIYGQLNMGRRNRRTWLETREETEWNYMLSEVDFAKSLTAMFLTDPKVSGENKAALKEAVTVIIDLLLDPQTEDAELERWFSLLGHWFADPRTNRPGFRLKIPWRMRKWPWSQSR